MKALVGAFNQEKALVGTFSVILKSSGTSVCSSTRHRPTHQFVTVCTIRRPGHRTGQYGHSRHSRHCIVCRFLPISPLCPCPVSGRCWCWLLVTSGHVTINPTRAVPAWVPDLEWVRGATWVVSGVMTIETFTSTSCHLNIV